ncbi:MAG: RsmE family RNA methyltransferase [Bacillota bacterium]|nr:RsmE family RNA methyltransferase [Bacillota bacterium]
MHHFFIDPSQMDRENKRCRIKGPDVHHLHKVLRLTAGIHVSVSDGCGERYLAVIRSIDPEVVHLELLERLSQSVILLERPIRLIQGIAKGSKMDWIVQKNTEMGIAAIQPVSTEFTVVRFSTPQDAVKKQHRWQKIADEASKQSKRTSIPVVEPPRTLQEVLELGRQSGESRLRLLAHEKESASRLADVLQPEALMHYQGIEMWIGPEGGFSPEEVMLAKEAGIRTVGLGPRILRTETASLVLLSVLLYEMGVLEA